MILVGRGHVEALWLPCSCLLTNALRNHRDANHDEQLHIKVRVQVAERARWLLLHVLRLTGRLAVHHHSSRSQQNRPDPRVSGCICLTLLLEAGAGGYAVGVGCRQSLQPDWHQVHFICLQLQSIYDTHLSCACAHATYATHTQRACTCTHMRSRSRNHTTPHHTTSHTYHYTWVHIQKASRRV